MRGWQRAAGYPREAASGPRPCRAGGTRPGRVKVQGQGGGGDAGAEVWAHPLWTLPGAAAAVLPVRGPRRVRASAAVAVWAPSSLQDLARSRAAHHLRAPPRSGSWISHPYQLFILNLGMKHPAEPPAFPAREGCELSLG